MNIKTELLKEHIAGYVKHSIEDFEIDADKITDSMAIKISQRISNVIKNESYNDIDKVEAIVTIFEKYGLDTGS